MNPSITHQQLAFMSAAASPRKYPYKVVDDGVVIEPADMFDLLHEPAWKGCTAEEAVVEYLRRAMEENGEGVELHSAENKMREEQIHNLVMAPAYHPTPFWLRSALRAFHAGTATEADLELLRHAKAKFTAEAAAAREAGFKGSGAE